MDPAFFVPFWQNENGSEGERGSVFFKSMKRGGKI